MTYEEALDALSDPTRRMIFEQLRQGPRSVGELVAAVPVSQPAVSQHLRVLREADLVQVRKDGARRVYSLNLQGLTELRQYVEAIWDQVLFSFQQAAAQEEIKGEFE
jgi:DNA-binding transcriptional ArsR family regulator